MKGIDVPYRNHKEIDLCEFTREDKFHPLYPGCLAVLNNRARDYYWWWLFTNLIYWQHTTYSYQSYQWLADTNGNWQQNGAMILIKILWIGYIMGYSYQRFNQRGHAPIIVDRRYDLRTTITIVRVIIPKWLHRGTPNAMNLLSGDDMYYVYIIYVFIDRWHTVYTTHMVIFSSVSSVSQLIRVFDPHSLQQSNMTCWKIMIEFADFPS